MRAWGEIHGSGTPPLSLLPFKGGFVVETNDGTPAVCGFLYLTQSRMALIEWVVGNPNIERKQRDIALDELFEGIVNYAKDKGVEFLVGSIIHPKLLERCPKHGFIPQTGAVTVVRSLNCG